MHNMVLPISSAGGASYHQSGRGRPGPEKHPPTPSHPEGSIFFCPLREGQWSSKHRPNRSPTDGFYLQPLSLVCARLLTYFEELRAPLAQGRPPTHTP